MTVIKTVLYCEYLRVSMDTILAVVPREKRREIGGGSEHSREAHIRDDH